MSVLFGTRDGGKSLARESPGADKKSRQRGLWCWPAPQPEVKRVRDHNWMSSLRRLCGETQEAFIHTTKIHLKVWEGAGVSAWKPAWLPTLQVGTLRSFRSENLFLPGTCTGMSSGRGGAPSDDFMSHRHWLVAVYAREESHDGCHMVTAWDAQKSLEKLTGSETQFFNHPSAGFHMPCSFRIHMKIKPIQYGKCYDRGTTSFCGVQRRGCKFSQSPQLRKNSERDPYVCF